MIARKDTYDSDDIMVRRGRRHFPQMNYSNILNDPLKMPSTDIENNHSNEIGWVQAAGNMDGTMIKSERRHYNETSQSCSSEDSEETPIENTEPEVETENVQAVVNTDDAEIKSEVSEDPIETPIENEQITELEGAFEKLAPAAGNTDDTMVKSEKKHFPQISNNVLKDSFETPDKNTEPENYLKMVRDDNIAFAKTTKSQRKHFPEKNCRNSFGDCSTTPY